MNQEESMGISSRTMLAFAWVAAGVFAGGAAVAADVKVSMSGASEVPPVTTTAAGSGTISVADDGSVSGSITTTGMQGKAAHIHIAPAGKNGPVILPLTKDGDTYKVPAGAKLDAEQLKAFKAGELYVNAHTAANPGGEIRGQLK
jgi:hypothetical protein